MVHGGSRSFVTRVTTDSLVKSYCTMFGEEAVDVANRESQCLNFVIVVGLI